MGTKQIQLTKRIKEILKRKAEIEKTDLRGEMRRVDEQVSGLHRHPRERTDGLG